MFEQLKRFFGDIAGNSDPREFEDGDYRLAAAALLVHVADVDGITTPAERQRLRNILSDRFALDEEATGRLLEAATRSDEEAVDLYRFTSVLKRRLDDEGRRKIIEMMWEIAYADGSLHELEDNILWRVAELLGVSTNDRVSLKLRVAKRMQPTDQVDTPGEIAES